MKVREVIVCEAQRIVAPVPSVLKRQQRVSKVMQRIAKSNQQQQPTELDIVQAMRQHAAWQEQTDKAYVQRLRQQLAAAKGV